MLYSRVCRLLPDSDIGKLVVHHTRISFSNPEDPANTSCIDLPMTLLTGLSSGVQGCRWSVASISILEVTSSQIDCRTHLFYRLADCSWWLLFGVRRRQYNYLSCHLSFRLSGDQISYQYID